MRIAVLLYDRFTTLDAIGPYEVLSRLPGATVTFVAARPGPVRNDVGSVALLAEAAMDELTDPDIVLVPGGPGQGDLMEDAPTLEWLRTADATSTWTTSVCTGSLLLAAAGLLTGRRATTHWFLTEALARYGATHAVGQRVVMDGKYVTAAGVSAGIDMALTLAGRIAGDELAQVVQLAIEYDPEPPYSAGSPDKAPAAVVDGLRSNMAVLLGS